MSLVGVATKWQQMGRLEKRLWWYFRRVGWFDVGSVQEASQYQAPPI